MNHHHRHSDQDDRIVIYRNTNAPAVRIKFRHLDLTGSTIELVATPGAAMSTTFSTADGSVVLDDDDTIVWTYTQTFANSLSPGVSVKLDAYRVLEGVREKLGAFDVRVGGIGDYFEPGCYVIELPGAQGPQGIGGTVTVNSTQTLEPGEPAQVVNIGTPQAAILDFLIPRGPDGIMTSVVAGEAIEVDDTDPANPIVSLDPSPFLWPVIDRTTLKALDTTKYTAVLLKEAGREGVFLWKTGDYATLVATDTAEGIYVEADAVAASSGAWVRIYPGDVNLSWFGAAVNGTTDDTTPLTVAVAVSRAIGKRLLIPGLVAITSITVANTGTPVNLVGYGFGASKIVALNATGDVLTLNAWDSSIKSIGFTAASGVTRTSGAMVLLGGRAGIIDDFFIDKHHYGIVMSGSVANIRNGYFSWAADNTAIHILVTGGDTTQQISNVMGFAAPSGQKADTGIWVHNTSALTISRTSMITCRVGLLIAPATGENTVSVNVEESWFDNCTENGVVIQQAGSTSVARIRFSDTWMCSSGINGTQIIGTVKGVEFDNCHMCKNVSAGLNFGAGTVTDIKVRGGDYCENAYGLRFNSAVDEFSVIGVTAGRGMDMLANTTAGISIDAACDNFIVTGNRCLGNGTNIINGAGTGATKIVADNIAP